MVIYDPAFRAAAFVFVLNAVLFALVLHTGLSLWVDCGKPCGASPHATSVLQLPHPRVRR